MFRARKDWKGPFKSLLMHAGVVHLAARLTRAGVVILRYHSVQHNPERYANSIGVGIIHSTSVFATQMELVAQGCSLVTLDEVLAFIQGERDLPRRPVAVTFDDGYADNCEIAEPILRHFGIRASFYVTVNSIAAGRPPWFCRLRHAFDTTRRETWPDSAGSFTRQLQGPTERRSAFLVASQRCSRLVGGDQEGAIRTIEHELEVEALTSRECPMLDWAQVKRLHREGHIVGSHTLTHPNLAYIQEDALQKELADSKRRLEEELGVPVVHFSYPSPISEPHYTDRTMTGTMQAGYRTAVTCTQGLIRRGHAPLALYRLSAPPEKGEFQWNLENTFIGRRM
jgi:peptidoglycan/xylan/chitin deacetylase (PgdA/CDA1 family)